MKTIAILNAISPAEEAEIGITEFEQFEQFFDLVEHDLTLREFRITEGEFPASTTQFDGYLITGSPAGAYEYEQKPWIGRLIDFIQEARAAQRQLVGVCFGHQVLAQALGGRVEKVGRWGLGIEPVNFALDALPAQMAADLAEAVGHLYFCHQDQVTALPEGADRLAAAPHCPNVMFMLDEQVLGMQAHPEFTPTMMDSVLTVLADTLDPEQVQQVRDKMDQQKTDNQLVARWMVDFLQGSAP